MLDLSKSNIPSEKLKYILNTFKDSSDKCSLKNLLLAGTYVKWEDINNLVKNVKTLISIDLNQCRSIPRAMKRLLNEDELKGLR